MAILGHQVGQRLIDALGLPRYTRQFELRCSVDEVVTVHCEYYPEGGDGLVTALAEYELWKRPEIEQPKPVNFDAWMAERKDAAHQALMASALELSRMDERLEWDRRVAAMTDAEYSHEFMMGRIGLRPR